MKKNNDHLIDQGKMKKTANLNNLEPGDSVNEHRSVETGNLIQANKEIEQQNNNL
ncbi:MAG TPA: hypothetical protein VKZ77_14700 [Bacillaceae bacterium]|nr:hypothetical protein [Paenibacillus bovis]HLU23710.1 hypothetical protein [Bacillaceae bacterium]